ncbi:Metallo-dependent phosphatase [Neocallimastix californiae]|uniref:Purple acid phosphatase n=1 Tax=Neocallimastix californiae TaxID=1754190 RepID=A0A1Y2A8N5_9FUNG|nr:Metallo-dependent phosphatase [Neocallimastix californiae]|eukprot:ORY18879.1 Metallo-dependent phosphatase [Neocallimastix californiae]
MKKLLLISTFLVTYIKAEEPECWSLPRYPCCSNVTITLIKDMYGNKWGMENKNYCGILYEVEDTEKFGIAKTEIDENRINSPDYCWSENYYLGSHPCCKDQSPENIDHIDEKGITWGIENGEVCSIGDYHTFDLDREFIQETKEEWNYFKKKWDNGEKYNFERLSVFAGDNETMLNFGWYSTTDEIPKIRYSINKNMRDAEEFMGRQRFYKNLKGIKYYSNQVTITGLKRLTTYYYQRKLNDPQIGGFIGKVSYLDLTRVATEDESTRNDAFNWNRTIEKAFKVAGGKPSLLLSVGDQADSICQSHTEDEYVLEETQYSAFLYPKLLEGIPHATAVGNHEDVNENFRNHFNAPNTYRKIEDTNRLIPGYNYFFKFNDALVVVLETNHLSCQDYTNTIKRAIAKYPNTPWRLAMFHHNIYSTGEYHSQDTYIVDQLRPCLTPLLTSYHFDLVINGHDHYYSASHFISFDSSKNQYAVNKINESHLKDKIFNRDRKGTLFITANCSTASKLYGGRKEIYDYSYFGNQTYTATFGLLDFQMDQKNQKYRMKVNYFDVESEEVVDGAYIFEKDFDEINDGPYDFGDDFDYGENDDSIEHINDCWAYIYQKKCCSDPNTDIVFIEDGLWGFEDGDFCGIPINNSATGPATLTNKFKLIDRSVCWSKAINGNDCCQKPYAQIIETDENGRWSIDYNKMIKDVQEKKPGNRGKPKRGFEMKDDDDRSGDSDMNFSNTTRKGATGSFDIRKMFCGIYRVDENTVFITDDDDTQEQPPSEECWATKLGYKYSS